MTDAELRRRARRRMWIAIGAIVIGLALTLLLVWRQQAGTDRELDAVHDQLAAAEERSAANAAAAVANAEQLRELGEVPRVEPPEEPSTQLVPVGPTREQVQDAVGEYFALNPPEPGRAPRPAEIAAAVSNYLAEHPPERGPAGSSPPPEMVAAAVRDYLVANPPPPGQDGTDGTDGVDGQDATPEMVAEQVRAYIEANPLPLCPPQTAAEPRTVLTTDGPADVVICVVQDEQGEGDG